MTANTMCGPPKEGWRVSKFFTEDEVAILAQTGGLQAVAIDTSAENAEIGSKSDPKNFEESDLVEAVPGESEVDEPTREHWDALMESSRALQREMDAEHVESGIWDLIDESHDKWITKDSGARVEYASGMRRDTEQGKARFDLLIPHHVPYGDQLLTRFAELLTRGAEKYSARNWEKASSPEELDRFRSSALRHMMQWFTGELDEDHAAAVMFNLLAAETLRYKLESATPSGSTQDSNTGEESCACKECREEGCTDCEKDCKDDCCA